MVCVLEVEKRHTRARAYTHRTNKHDNNSNSVNCGFFSFSFWFRFRFAIEDCASTSIVREISKYLYQNFAGDFPLFCCFFCNFSLPRTHHYANIEIVGSVAVTVTVDVTDDAVAAAAVV